MNRSARRLALPLIALIAFAPPALAGQAAPDTVRGTIRSVDAAAGMFDVVTGVGMALWVVPLKAGTGAYITADGAPLRLADLKPGDIVRVQYRRTAEGNICERVERVGRLESGRGGAP